MLLGRPLPLLIALAAVACATVAAIGSAGAATTTTVVGLDVLSSTNLDASACAANVADRTHFGSVNVDSSYVTGTDCTLTFGSSNSTGQLRVAQTDTLGIGMFQGSRGATDPSFSGDGIQIVDFGAAAARQDRAWAAVAQPDGKVVLGGSCNVGAPQFENICAARFDVSGALDPTFSGDGLYSINVGTAGLQYDFAMGIALQPDGRIVLAGLCEFGASLRDLCMVRLTSAGVLDTTFDGDGIRVVTDPNQDQYEDVAIQPDGRVVGAGFCDEGATGEDICVTRFLSDGAVDTTFDGDGFATAAVGAGGAVDRGAELAVQPDGKIVVAGTCDMGATGLDLCVVRLTSTGALDPTFDGDGRLTVPATANDDYGTSLLLQADGTILVGGDCDGSACISKHDASGAPDTTWDVDGLSLYPSAIEVVGIAAEPSGRIIAATKCGYLCALRLADDGSLDTTLDGDGEVAVDTSSGFQDTEAVLVLPDGELLVSGSCLTIGPSMFDFCLTNLSTGGSLTQYSNGAADWDTASTNLFGACLRNVTGGAATWTVNAGCPATDGAYWNAVPAVASQVASANPLSTTSTASLRFGLRTTVSQTPGTYVAPITFDVVAP